LPDATTGGIATGDTSLLVDRNTDTGICNFKPDNGFSPAENGMTRRPAAFCLQNGQPHLTLFGEFEGIRKKILQDLLQTLGIGHQALAKRRIGGRFKRQTAIFSFMPERPRNHLQ
jgi:hypothetical protein